MKQYLTIIFFLLSGSVVKAQSVQQQLQKSMQQLMADSQLKHGIAALCVVNTITGRPVFEYNSQLGLTPASTQKIFTSIAAFELLGASYRFKTLFGYDGTIKDSILTGDLFIKGSGDPTLGSWRFTKQTEWEAMNAIAVTIKKLPVKKLTGTVRLYQAHFSAQSIPDGWIWQDIGNYYGAGSASVNWHENQYDLSLDAGKSIGEKVSLSPTSGSATFFSAFTNELKTGAKGSGDNAYIYPAIDNRLYPLVKGTIPVNEKEFSISGALPNPAHSFLRLYKEALWDQHIEWQEPKPSWTAHAPITTLPGDTLLQPTIFYTHYSPPLDSINYFFLRKSINLYGEAITKVLALEKEGYGDTEKGIGIIKNFWQQRGISKEALHILDGSGLSPQNRVTAFALVQALQYAKNQSWYPLFYNALPEYNGMKIKSGSVNGARAFAGYHTAKNGNKYTVAIIVNNYSGSTNAFIKKMYTVLDALK